MPFFKSYTKLKYLTSNYYEYILKTDSRAKIAKQRSRLSLKIKKIGVKNMPRYNGTGPMGAGPGTGWGLGPCGAGMAWGRGWGRGFRKGFGFRRFISPKNELAALEDEEKILEEELAAIKEEKAALKAQLK
jgi:hypothetical protein